MEAWSFARVLSFCLAHARQPIAVRQRGTTLRLAGLLEALDERDACSMDLVEAELNLGVPGVACTLSLHETTLLIHLSAGAKESGLFFPLSIPYADLVLEGPAAAPAAAESGALPPYERL